jgi:NTE family protein
MRLRLLAISLLLLASAPTRAAEPDTCLVLSGGGARGMAHIGVIKVLERERIPVDCIVGTSMGAVVGSLYASGLTADEIEARVRELDWTTMFSDRVDRTVFPQRRKAEDRTFLAKAGVGLREGRLSIPPSLFEGQRLAVALRTSLLASAGINHFDDLPIPFRAIGTDLETGEAVVMGDGDLVNAVRASMAVPGAFAPVTWGERSLIDGGVAMNLPIEAAQGLGARRVIAVDIGAKLKSREELTDPLAITDQMVTALMLKENRRQVARLRAGDVLIEPPLGPLSSADFVAGMNEGIALGEQATVAMLPQLRAYQVSPEAYAAWRAARAAKLQPLGPIERIELVNTSAVADSRVRAQVQVQPGDAIDPVEIEKDLSRIHGSGEVSRAYYVIDRQDDDTVLTYVVRSRRWAEDGTIKFGLFMQDDFQGNGEYQLGARFTRGELNRFGGDVVLEGRLGDNNRFFAEWNQPLDPVGLTFVRPSLERRARNRPLLNDFSLAAEYRHSAWEADLKVGMSLGTWGEGWVAPFARRNTFDLREELTIGRLPRSTTSSGVAFGITIDTQDDAEFPGTGWFVHARHARYLSQFDSDTEGHTTRVRAQRAFTAGRGRWQVALEGQDRRGDAYEDVALLGGPFRLSGYGINQLRGNGLWLATLQYNQPLAQVLEYPVFLGGSLEAGQAWRRDEEPSLGAALVGGSVYGAVDTPLGPMFIGFGITEGGEESVFFRLGQPD